MNAKMNNLLTPAAAAASLLLLGSCVEDKEDPAVATPSDNSDLLIGEWEVVTIDGEVYEESDSSTYTLVMKFESDGDFGLCVDFDNKFDPSENYEDCYEGDWEWITKGEELTFSWEDEYEDESGTVTIEKYEIDFEITKLTATELEGDWTNKSENETYEFVLKKN